jgi:hypothetical protein
MDIAESAVALCVVATAPLVGSSTRATMSEPSASAGPENIFRVTSELFGHHLAKICWSRPEAGLIGRQQAIW